MRKLITLADIAQSDELGTPAFSRTGQWTDEPTPPDETGANATERAEPSRLIELADVIAETIGEAPMQGQRALITLEALAADAIERRARARPSAALDGLLSRIPGDEPPQILADFFDPLHVGEGSPRLYPHEPSVRADGTLQIHVASTANYLMLSFHRLTGNGLAPQYHKLFPNPSPGKFDEANETGNTDWDWPSVSLDLKSANVPPGVYVIWMQQFASQPKNYSPPVIDPSDLVMSENDVNQAVKDGVWKFVKGPPATLLVVRPAARSSNILCVIPVFTYHAYNVAGGDSFYHDQEKSTTLTLRRRGGGIGYRVSPPSGINANRIYDPANLLGTTFMNHDYRWITWLQNNLGGAKIDFCADSDFSADAYAETTKVRGQFGLTTTAGYTLLVFLGHDEYWTDEKKAAVDDFVRRGGNAAFLGGNTCWWRVTHDVPNATIRCDKPDDRWFKKGPNNDDAKTTGLSYRVYNASPIPSTPVAIHRRIPPQWLLSYRSVRRPLDLREHGADGGGLLRSVFRDHRARSRRHDRLAAENERARSA